MTKEQCLALLEEVENKIQNHTWECQVEDPNSLVEHSLLSEYYLKDFGLPEAELMNDNNCILLPVGWLEGEDKESSSYKEVAEKYTEVYSFMRYEVSRENEALDAMYDDEDRNCLGEYWGSVL